MSTSISMQPLYLLGIYSCPADDRAKTMKLKSHCRVISSHSPQKAAQAEEEAPAHQQEEAALSQGDEYSTTSSPVEEHLTYLDEDLMELIDAPLEEQLEKILGLKEAEEVLKPSFREGARRTLNPLLLRKSMHAFTMNSKKPSRKDASV